MRLPDLSDPAVIAMRCPLLVKRVLMFFIRLLCTFPLLAYEVWLMRRILLREMPTILHVNSGGYPAALSTRAAVIAAKLARVPSILMVVNNLAINYSRPSRWIDYPIDRLVARCTSTFVTASASASEQLRRVLRLEEGKCMSLHNGITLRARTESRSETRARLGLEKYEGVVFGVVAILRKNKGHHILLNALRHLIISDTEIGSKIKILIEGDGPLSDNLKKFVIQHNLSDHCIFVGEEENVMDFIAALDVLILPSIGDEDFPNVILEAMGLGVPVIASRIAGVPEQVIDGTNGYVVSPFDVEELANAMKILTADSATREKMRDAGLSRFRECFTADVAVARYAALYQSFNEAPIV